MYITDYTDVSEMDLEAVVSDIEEKELVTRKTGGPDIDRDGDGTIQQSSFI